MQQISLPGLNVSGEGKKKNLKKNIAPGTKFNRLTVIRSISRTKDRHIIYQCRCDCGNTVNVRDNNLHSGNTQSCGCLNQENRKENALANSIDLKGRRFGKQVAIKESGKNKKGEIVWLLRCDCGREFSRVGRFLRMKPNAKRCPCQTKAHYQPPKTKRVPRNNEQFAWDIYNMYIKEGWSLRRVAEEEGFSRGAAITRLLMDHIPEYREQSIQRREDSKDNEQNRKRKKLSKLYHFESDFQRECVNRLLRANIYCVENDKSITGYEIDVKTESFCLELKTRVARKDIYRAMGQLQINASRSNLKPGLVVPSDVELDSGQVKELVDCGVRVLTEENLINSIS